jgi:hypothetical protein
LLCDSGDKFGRLLAEISKQQLLSFQ